jgi:hypothetical protein
MRRRSLLIGFIICLTAASIAQSSAVDTKNLIVPAGTQIKVDLWNRNVAWPVQDGFTVLIPALAKVSFKSTTSQQSYDVNGTTNYLPPQKTIELKSIKLGRKSYAIEADAVTVPENQREVVITLREPLEVAR